MLGRTYARGIPPSSRGATALRRLLMCVPCALPAGVCAPTCNWVRADDGSCVHLRTSRQHPLGQTITEEAATAFESGRITRCYREAPPSRQGRPTLLPQKVDSA